MKLEKQTALCLIASTILPILPMDSFANDVDDDYSLQKSLSKKVEVDTWISGLANMPTAREGFSAVEIDGKIYCIGGSNSVTGTTRVFNTLEVYDLEKNTWETKASMSTERVGLSSVVIDGKIYCMGGYNYTDSYLNTLEVYDPKTDTWETKASMPEGIQNFSATAFNGKAYIFGGSSNAVPNNGLDTVLEYDPKTDIWKTKASMPTPKRYFKSVLVNDKIYCLPGVGLGPNKNIIEVYDPKTDTWDTSKRASMPIDVIQFSASVIGDKIYCIGGNTGNNVVQIYDTVNDDWSLGKDDGIRRQRNQHESIAFNGRIYCIGGNYNGSVVSSVDVYIATLSLEEEVENALETAQLTKNPSDIMLARNLVNQLPESAKKDGFQAVLNSIFPNITSTPKSATSNVDIYIKSDNMLSLALDTNSITFEDFSGVEDVEKQNAVTLLISSSLPYEVNAQLPTEIQNADKSSTMDKEILNIKANSEASYSTFTDLNTPALLLDNQSAGNDVNHGIDLKLKGGISHKKDSYKTTIKFEVNQK